MSNILTALYIMMFNTPVHIFVINNLHLDNIHTCVLLYVVL